MERKRARTWTTECELQRVSCTWEISHFRCGSPEVLLYVMYIVISGQVAFLLLLLLLIFIFYCNFLFIYLFRVIIIFTAMCAVHIYNMAIWCHLRIVYSLVCKFIGLDRIVFAWIFVCVWTEFDGLTILFFWPDLWPLPCVTK